MLCKGRDAAKAPSSDILAHPSLLIAAVIVPIIAVTTSHWTPSRTWLGRSKMVGEGFVIFGGSLSIYK